MGMDEGNFWQWAATVATGALASLGLWTTKRAIKRLDDLEAKHSALDVHVARSMVPRGEISAALDRIADKIDASSRSIRDHVDAGLQKVHERIDNHNDTHR